jgi:hypothetical protein
MRRLGLLAVLIGALISVFPSVASAGWAGSRYDKSECALHVGKDGRPFLSCQSSFVETDVVTGELSVADASCRSGSRLIRRVQTIEMTWIVFDLYSGPAPLAAFNIGGDEFPVSSRLISSADTDLGCTT